MLGMEERAVVMEAEGTVVARAVDMVVDRSDRNLIRFFLY